jgi:hypothetical protein
MCVACIIIIIIIIITGGFTATKICEQIADMLRFIVVSLGFRVDSRSRPSV